MASLRTAVRSEGSLGDLGTLVEAASGPEGSRQLPCPSAAPTTHLLGGVGLSPQVQAGPLHLGCVSHCPECALAGLNGTSPGVTLYPFPASQASPNPGRAELLWV